MIKVEIRFKHIFCEVPAFNLVEPATISFPVFKTIGQSEILEKLPFTLFSILTVRHPILDAIFNTSKVNGVFPLALMHITTSELLRLCSFTKYLA